MAAIILGWYWRGRGEVKQESDERITERTKFEHRVTALEERSLSKEDVAAFHKLTSTVDDMAKKLDELCSDYKETVRFIYRDLPLALKKLTSPKYDAMLDRLSASWSDELNAPTLPLGDMRKIYAFIKADHARAVKKEDQGRIVMTTLIIRRMEKDFGFGGHKAKTSKACAV